MRHAIASDDPTIFLEPKRLYWTRQTLDRSVQAAPIGRAEVRRHGQDATLIAYGASVHTALAAAEAAADSGLGLSVVDLRSLVPFDDATVCAAVRQTGRAIVVHEAAGFCGVGAEIAARVTERCFYHLEAPVLRVTGLDIPYPPPLLESWHLPSVERILAAVTDLGNY
jgi:pyruvate dehydrogenase E1 component beta subunit